MCVIKQVRWKKLLALSPVIKSYASEDIIFKIIRYDKNKEMP